MQTRLTLVLLLAATLTACGGGVDVVQQEVSTDVYEPVAEPAAQVMTMAPTVKTAGGFSSSGMSPSQVRTRYGLSGFTTPVQQGAGQTIAIIGAYNNPNAAEDLAKFSTQHGLASCPFVPNQYARGADGYPSVLNTSAGDSCTFQIINVDSTGHPSARVRNGAWVENSPQVDANWMAETTMDIQWAHAIAPRAKIILVQAPNNYISGLAYAVQYASKLAGVVSMSWGAAEAGLVMACTPNEGPSCTSLQKTQTTLFGAANPIVNGVVNYTGGGYDTIGFNNPSVTYVAASGDRGNVPMWPAVSDRVLAVGATNTKGATDIAWNSSGGGLSKYYAAPAWQAGLGYTSRATPDVAFVGDPATPVSVYITPSKYMPDTSCVKSKGASNCGWYGGYGTSAGAPQWAGIAAIARAIRESYGMNPSLNLNPTLYGISAVPGYYLNAFGDVTVGNNGHQSKVGYDMVTGLGVPNVGNLMGYLTR